MTNLSLEITSGQAANIAGAGDGKKRAAPDQPVRAIMKKQYSIVSLVLVVAAIILLIAGVVLSFQGKSTNIATYSAAIICLIFSQLQRFEYFEGLGIKAKLRDLQESVETIISTSTVDTEDPDDTHTSIESLARDLGLSHTTEASLDTIISKLRDKKYSFRTSHGLAKDTSLSTNTIQHIIIQLYEKGYVNKAHSQSKGVLWTLSDKGKAVKPLNYEE